MNMSTNNPSQKLVVLESFVNPSLLKVANLAALAWFDKKFKSNLFLPIVSGHLSFGHKLNKLAQDFFCKGVDIFCWPPSHLAQ